PHTFDAQGKSRYNIDERLLNVPKRRQRKQWFKDTLTNWAYHIDKIPDMDKAGGEHIEDIILGLEGRTKDMTLHELHLNIPNGGAVPNLPREAILELTVTPKGKAFKPVKNPELDLYRWGVLSPLVALNELSAKAAI